MSEHWQTGAMSRNMPWLAGLTPSAFVEIGTALAKREGIKNGDRVIVSSARGSIEVYALVTERFQPFFVDGRLIDEIGLPWHWGYAGIVPATSPTISPPASATPTRTFPRPRSFSATSSGRGGHDNRCFEAEGDDPGQPRCIGCRACMVACKSWNDRPEDQTVFFAGEGYQNPRDLDANNYTLITFNEITTGARPDWVFGRQLCMHCEHPACASACPTTALTKTALGPVVFNEARCIGCRACMQACPFLIPKYDYENRAPMIHVHVLPTASRLA